MSSLVTLPGNNKNPDRHSYDYYYNKIRSDKETSVAPGDVYKKVSNENIFKTLPGIQGAIYLIKKVTNEEGRWNKTRKIFGAAHGTISIKYERIMKDGNVPVYLDEKPLTANFYNWGQWNYDFMLVGKIWNVEGEPHIEFLEDIARRQAYEDPKNKEERREEKRREEEEERERVDREAEEAVIKFIKEEEEERRRREKRDKERLQKISNDIRRRENWEREQRERDERIRERDMVIRGGGNPNVDIMSEMTIPKLKF